MINNINLTLDAAYELIEKLRSENSRKNDYCWTASNPNANASRINQILFKIRIRAHLFNSKYCKLISYYYFSKIYIDRIVRHQKTKVYSLNVICKLVS